MTAALGAYGFDPRQHNEVEVVGAEGGPLEVIVGPGVARSELLLYGELACDLLAGLEALEEANLVGRDGGLRYIESVALVLSDFEGLNVPHEQLAISSIRDAVVPPEVHQRVGYR